MKLSLTGLFLAFLSMSVFMACQKPIDSPEEDVSVEVKVPKRDPKLVVAPARVMDISMSQTSPEKVVATAVANPNSDFFLHQVNSYHSPTIISGAKFEPEIDVNQEKLSLRGATIRRFEMSSISLITIYAAGFYMNSSLTAQQWLDDVEKVMILEYRMDVPKEKVVESIHKNVREDPTVNIDEVLPYFEQLSDAFDSPEKGDRYEFVYLPGRGTAMIKKGKILTIVPTREFEKAFFGIWLGDHHEDMRCELLDLPCEKKSLNPLGFLSKK